MRVRSLLYKTMPSHTFDTTTVDIEHLSLGLHTVYM
jgi:hypothetical protein